jgi:hypothetical protein
LLSKRTENKQSHKDDIWLWLEVRNKDLVEVIVVLMRNKKFIPGKVLVKVLAISMEDIQVTIFMNGVGTILDGEDKLQMVS